MGVVHQSPFSSVKATIASTSKITTTSCVKNLQLSLALSIKRANKFEFDLRADIFIRYNFNQARCYIFHCRFVFNKDFLDK